MKVLYTNLSVFNTWVLEWLNMKNGMKNGKIQNTSETYNHNSKTVLTKLNGLSIAGGRFNHFTSNFEIRHPQKSP